MSDSDPEVVSTETPDADATLVEAEVLSDGEYTLVIADFSDLESAREAYGALTEATEASRLHIEGVLIVSKNDDGTIEVQKATDLRTRRGLALGAVGGLVFGVLFPPSIIGSIAVAGAAGAGIGRLRHRHYRDELAEELAAAIDPGHSAILALISDPSAIEINKALDKANRIVEKAVDKAAAEELKAEAQSAGGQAEPGDTA